MARKTKYSFTLKSIDLKALNAKYGIESKIPVIIPENSSSIDELVVSQNKKPEIISFIDETKAVVKCAIALPNKNCNCFWDRHPIPTNIRPISCPIRYVPRRATKAYFSEISKETYTISEPIPEDKVKQITDDRIVIGDHGYYYSDGVFCSFNCCLAYIRDNKKNPMYVNSEMLLLQIYNTTFEQKIGSTQIIPAPHWRMLIEYGGTLNINSFRDNLNIIQYSDRGIYFNPFGNLIEDSFRI